VGVGARADVLVENFRTGTREPMSIAGPEPGRPTKVGVALVDVITGNGPKVWDRHTF